MAQCETYLGFCNVHFMYATEKKSVFCFLYVLIYILINQWHSVFSSTSICTNSSSWIEKILSLEALPDSILLPLKGVHDSSTKTQNSLEELLGSTTDISKRIDMMKFIRNATLLFLTAFPRNYILEEAALVAEELSVMKMNSCSSSDTPCRALAKSLLKSDRQVFIVPLRLLACTHYIFHWQKINACFFWVETHDILLFQICCGENTPCPLNYYHFFIYATKLKKVAFVYVKLPFHVKRPIRQR